MLPENCISIETTEFLVTLDLNELVVNDIMRNSQKTDMYINFRHKIERKTSRATKYQIKKFLRKWVITAIKQKIAETLRGMQT